jgi:3-keto-L-gulonate-6-phosphate decarboxylase
MPDEQDPQGTSEQDQPQGEQQETTPPSGPSQEALDKVKAESRKWEQRAKADAKALADMKAAMKSVVTPEQAADKDAQLVAAIAAAEKATAQATKYRVALAEGLPMDLADRLVGDDEDELRKDAAKLKALLKPVTPGADARKGQGKEKDETKPSANELIRILAHR